MSNTQQPPVDDLKGAAGPAVPASDGPLGSVPKLAEAEVANALRRTLQSQDIAPLNLDEGKLIAAVQQRRSEMEQKLQPFLTSREHAREDWSAGVRVGDRRRRIVIQLVVAFWVLLVPPALVALHSLAQITWLVHYYDFSGWVWLSSNRWASLAVFGILVSAAMAAPVLARVALSRIDSTTFPAYNRKESADREFEQYLYGEVDGLARQLINSPEMNLQTDALTLRTLEAPTLVEIDSADAIEGATVGMLEDFIRRHETSAVGIAGPRGVGKTTIMQQICNSDSLSSLGVLVSVPVYYTPSEFVRYLHGEVARALLREGAAKGRRRVISQREASGEPTPLEPALNLRLVIGAVAFYLGILIVVADVAGWGTGFLSSQFILGIGLSGAGFALFYSVLGARRSARRLVRSADDALSLAQRELQTLRWEVSHQSRYRTGFALFSQVTTEDEQQAGFTERQQSHPEQIAAFKDFILEYHRLERRPVIVAIDELDKIAKPSDAIELINGLKDLFHIRDTHFIVSVSEDALESFALRGVPVRDVFDSSFDAVFPVKPFLAKESLRLLDRRVVKFPPAAGLLCHALSGGIPRDLIRAARLCIGFPRHDDKTLTLSEMTDRLCAAELMESVEAVLRRQRKLETTVAEAALMRLQGQLSPGPLQPGMLFPGLTALQHVDGAGTSDEGHSMLRQFAVYCYVVCTAHEYFGQFRTAEAWAQVESTGAALRCADAIASSRRAVGSSVVEAAAALARARELCGLPNADGLECFAAREAAANGADKSSWLVRATLALQSAFGRQTEYQASSPRAVAHVRAER